MGDQQSLVSNVFQTFASEAPQHAKAWRELVQNLTQASALDNKTASLVYLAVLAAQRIESGIPFHVISCQKSRSLTRRGDQCHFSWFTTRG